MRVEELLRFLAPVYGDRILRLREVYLLGDEKDRREIESELRVLYARLVSQTNTPLLPPPPTSSAIGEIVLGEIVYGRVRPRPWGISREELRRHLLVAGATGSGKTNFVTRLLKVLTVKKLPWLVLDPMRSYRGLRDSARVYTVGREVSPLQISLLSPPEGVPKKEWITKVSEVLGRSLDLGEGAQAILREEFMREGGSSSLVGVRARAWKETASRALRMISEGPLAGFFRPGPSPRLLLDENTILEIDGLSETEKAVFSDLLILWIHNFRLGTERKLLSHVLVVEEAHHLLHSSARIRERPVERILREGRGLGQAIVVVDQEPSLLSPQVISQCGTRITFQLAERDDLSAAAKYSLLSHDEVGAFGRLPVGFGIVKGNVGWFEPFLTRFDLQPETGMNLPDDAIRGALVIDSAHSASEVAVKEEPGMLPALPVVHTPDIERLLADVSSNPFIGILARCKSLGWSARRIERTISNAEVLGLLKRVKIQSGAKTSVLLEPTEEGIRTMKSIGLALPSGGRLGGIVHRYWIDEIAKVFESIGCAVVREEAFGEKIVDLVVSHLGKTLLVEVETGRKHGVMA